MKTKMTEDAFTEELITALAFKDDRHVIARKRSILYELSIDDCGCVQMGIDRDSGIPIRGKGKGFEQDILIFQESINGHTSVIPRVVAEVKYNGVTTHDTIVYAEKARRIRSVYPYLRYGIILGNFKTIPGRVLRLGQEFDFACAIQYPLIESQLRILREILQAELDTSLDACKLLFGQRKVSFIHRAFRVYDEKARECSP